MSPWTAFLESLHSALIDELIERHPEPKPELGMPSRHRELLPPAAGALNYFAAEVTMSTTRGAALIALDAEAEALLRLSPAELWKAVFRRAGTEFHRRAIMPKLDTEKSVTDLDNFGKGLQKVVWIPFKLGSQYTAVCYLGMGIT